LEPERPDGTESQQLETGHWKLATKNWPLETGNWKLAKLAAGNWQLETQ
jgi:hypothetical protein